MRVGVSHWVALVSLVGCTQTVEPSPGVSSPVPATCTVNPYGACYPTSDLGSAVGDRIGNFCFGLPTTECLSQLYDPEQRDGNKLLVLNGCAAWVGPCSVETDLITGSNASGANASGVSWAKELAPLGVVFAQVMEEGTDLASWVAAHDAQSLYESSDPSQIAAFYSAAAIPLNIVIDLRSMEILSVDVGFDTQMDVSIRKRLAMP